MVRLLMLKSLVCIYTHVYNKNKKREKKKEKKIPRTQLNAWKCLNFQPGMWDQMYTPGNNIGACKKISYDFSDK